MKKILIFTIIFLPHKTTNINSSTSSLTYHISLEHPAHKQLIPPNITTTVSTNPFPNHYLHQSQPTPSPPLHFQTFPYNLHHYNTHLHHHYQHITNPTRCHNHILYYQEGTIPYLPSTTTIAILPPLPLAISTINHHNHPYQSPNPTPPAPTLLRPHHHFNKPSLRPAPLPGRILLSLKEPVAIKDTRSLPSMTSTLQSTPPSPPSAAALVFAEETAAVSNILAFLTPAEVSRIFQRVSYCKELIFLTLGKHLQCQLVEFLVMVDILYLMFERRSWRCVSTTDTMINGKPREVSAV